MFIINIPVLLVFLQVTSTFAAFFKPDKDGTVEFNKKTEEIILQKYELASVPVPSEFPYSKMAKAIAFDMNKQDIALENTFSSKMGFGYFVLTSNNSAAEKTIWELINQHLDNNLGKQLLGFGVAAGKRGGNEFRCSFYFIHGYENATYLQGMYSKHKSGNNSSPTIGIPISAWATQRVLLSINGKDLTELPDKFVSPGDFIVRKKGIVNGNINPLEDKDWIELFSPCRDTSEPLVLGIIILENFIVVCVDTRCNRNFNADNNQRVELPEIRIISEEKSTLLTSDQNNKEEASAESTAVDHKSDTKEANEEVKKATLAEPSVLPQQHEDTTQPTENPPQQAAINKPNGTEGKDEDLLQQEKMDDTLEGEKRRDDTPQWEEKQKGIPQEEPYREGEGKLQVDKDKDEEAKEKKRVHGNEGFEQEFDEAGKKKQHEKFKAELQLAVKKRSKDDDSRGQGSEVKQGKEETGEEETRTDPESATNSPLNPSKGNLQGNKPKPSFRDLAQKQMIAQNLANAGKKGKEGVEKRTDANAPILPENANLANNNKQEQDDDHRSNKKTKQDKEASEEAEKGGEEEQEEGGDETEEEEEAYCREGPPEGHPEARESVPPKIASSKPLNKHLNGAAPVSTDSSIQAPSVFEVAEGDSRTSSDADPKAAVNKVDQPLYIPDTEWTSKLESFMIDEWKYDANKFGNKTCAHEKFGCCYEGDVMLPFFPFSFLKTGEIREELAKIARGATIHSAQSLIKTVREKPSLLSFSEPYDQSYVCTGYYVLARSWILNTDILRKQPKLFKTNMTHILGISRRENRKIEFSMEKINAAVPTAIVLDAFDGKTAKTSASIMTVVFVIPTAKK